MVQARVDLGLVDLKEIQRPTAVTISHYNQERDHGNVGYRPSVGMDKGLVCEKHSLIPLQFVIRARGCYGFGGSVNFGARKLKITDLEKFADDLKAKFALPGTVSPEDQLKCDVSSLIVTTGGRYGVSVKTRTEPHLSEHGVRPDIAIYVGGLICGYVELKAPGLGADASKLKSRHNKEQWKKLQGLPNIIYTDGQEWSLYRFGRRPNSQPLVRLADDPTEKGKAATSKANAEALERLFRDFLGWKPNVPHNPTGLAAYLAPLSRFLRFEVEKSLLREDSAVSLLFNEWQQFFFPDADNPKFADAYAQTVTYALLLARLSGATKLDTPKAVKTLDANNGLLARTLALLGQPDARKELLVGFELLQRSLEALDSHVFLKSKPDLWLYFYEDFLAAYDCKLRNDYGVYYTPIEVVELQVRLAAELLEKRFGKKLGFADDGVVFLDPATGTGTYPVAAVKHGMEKVRNRSGVGAIPARARQMAENMHGFEILVGPYAVAHLRLTQALEGAINAAKSDGEPDEKLDKRLHIYLADTLESPNAAPPGGLTLTYRALTQEHESARKVKQGDDILVCLGNPPYDRQHIEEGDTTTKRKGGWVRYGDQVEGAADTEKQGDRPIFQDFTQPTSDAGAGVHLKNIYNDYVYFWRWALWRLFEQQACGGIVTFITGSSYLAGPGFIGMREVMRRTFDELWIIDLGGDGLGTRQTPNVFNIRTPVAIAIGVRATKPSPHTPARVRYALIDGPDRENKLAQLEAVAEFKGLEWRDCPNEWHKPFRPFGKGDYFHWPSVIDIFPYQRTGTKFGRTWPIAETPELLRKRWDKLISETGASRAKHFKNNANRKIARAYKDHVSGVVLPKLNSLKIGGGGGGGAKISPYAFRSFDRHYAIEDNRVCDRIAEVLWRVQGKNQLYLTVFTTEALASGPGIIASSSVPDLHHFRGSFGGKDIIPLYRDAAGIEANVTSGLIDILRVQYGTSPTVEDIAGYVYALLGGQSYTRRFWNELETPGPHVPLTKDRSIFFHASRLGQKLIWLHTYAKCFKGVDRNDEVPKGKATTVKGVSTRPNQYPTEFSYDSSKYEIVVGDGRFGPVTTEVWKFEVSGLKVVQSWLGYRMKKRAGKKSSPLDDIRPERWTARMSDEFLELLWVLEATLALEPELEKTLDNVVDGSCFCASELPVPTANERKPPGKPTNEEQSDLFGEGEEE